MSLKSERFRQFVNYKNQKSTKCLVGNTNKHNEKIVTVNKNLKKRHKMGIFKKIFAVLKNVCCFSGIWILVILHMIGLDLQKYWLMCVAVVVAIAIGNLNLYLVGKRNYELWDAFNVLELTDSTWRFQEQLEKNPTRYKELELHGKGGIYFGSKDGVDIGKKIGVDGHVVVFGGSGSGKSSCVAIPTLNRWTAGAFIVDIKDGGELQRKSTYAGSAKVFRPGDAESVGYDPFLFVDKRSPENDLLEIAYSLIPQNPKNPDDFWTNNEQRYLHSALYYCYDMGQSFLESCRTIHSLSSKELLENIRDGQCAFARNGMSDFYGMADQTLGGIVAGVGNAISIFATDPDILSVLSKSEKMTPEMLLEGERIFVCIPEHKLDIYRNLLQLIICQFCRYFEKLSDGETRPVLMMLDEFARLGKYELLINGLATLRSKQITMMILTQSVSQFDAIYGNENRKVMLDNCAYKVVLNASDPDSQKYFSTLVGNYTKHQRSYSRGKSSSYNISEHEMPVIKPEKLATLKKMLLMTPYGHQWVDKRPYYRELNYKKKN